MDTTNWITLVTGLIAGLGIGAVVAAFVQHLLKIRETSYHSQRQDLEGRYKVIILLMYAAFDFESNKASLQNHRPTLKSKQDVLDELKTEWHNMLLFASGETQKSLHDFILKPDVSNLKKAAMCMREDLGRDDISCEIEPLNFET